MTTTVHVHGNSLELKTRPPRGCTCNRLLPAAVAAKRPRLSCCACMIACASALTAYDCEDTQTCVSIRKHYYFLPSASRNSIEQTPRHIWICKMQHTVRQCHRATMSSSGQNEPPCMMWSPMRALAMLSVYCTDLKSFLVGRALDSPGFLMHFNVRDWFHPSSISRLLHALSGDSGKYLPFSTRKVDEDIWTMGPTGTTFK